MRDNAPPGLQPIGVRRDREGARSLFRPTDIRITGSGESVTNVRRGGKRVRFADATTYFLDQWPAEGPSADTVRTYTGQLKWLVAFASRHHRYTLAEALEPDFLRSAMAEKMAAAASHPNSHKGGEAAANSLGCAARKMASWLLAQGLPAPDVTLVRLPRVPERVQPRLRDEEFRALESAVLRHLVDGTQRALVSRDLALIYLLADTGLRAQELCAMTVESIDFSTGSVIIYRGKFGKGRALSIIDPEEPGGGRTLRLLAEWIEARAMMHGTAAHDRLWVSYKGKPLTGRSVRSVLSALCVQARISGNRPPHAFRRANFTEAYRLNPLAIGLISARMGWSPKSYHMAAIYTRGAEIDFARTVPVPSLSAQWHQSTVANVPRVPIPITAAGLRASYVERPSPVSPTKETQGLGRLPSSRTSRRYSV